MKQKIFMYLIMLLMLIVPVLGAQNTTVTCNGNSNGTTCIINDKNSVDTGLIIFIAAIWLVVFVVSFWLPYMFIVDIVLSIFLAFASSNYWTGMPLFLNFMPIVVTVISSVLVFAFNNNSKR